MKIRQIDKILYAMLHNPEKKEWSAKDFQSGEYFIGYEASARMSEIQRIYPDKIIVGKDGRFRTLSINWDNIDENFKKQIDGYIGTN